MISILTFKHCIDHNYRSIQYFNPQNANTDSELHVTVLINRYN